MSQSNDNGNNSSHEQQDNSNSSSDFDDVYHRRIQEALKEIHHPTADFYSKDKGKKKMALRPRVEPPPTTDHASDSDLDVDPSKQLDSDDSCTDKHFQPLSSSSDSRDEFASSSKSPSKSPSKRRGASRQRGRPRGSRRGREGRDICGGRGSKVQTSPRKLARGARGSKASRGRPGKFTTRGPSIFSEDSTPSQSPVLPEAESNPSPVSEPERHNPVGSSLEFGTPVQTPVQTPVVTPRHRIRSPPGIVTQIDKGSGRKRKKDTANWKKNVAKRLKAEGQAYISVKTGLPMPAAKVGRPCGCPRNCFDQFTDEQIQRVFRDFWAIGDNYVAKSSHLNGLIRDRPVKRRRQKDPEKPVRKLYKYIIHVPDEVEVCRDALVSIHGISKDKIEKIIRDRKTNTSGTPVPDGRGLGPSHNAITGIRLQRVHDHIRSLAVQTSHYSRLHSPHRRYMAPGFTIATLYKDYEAMINYKYPGEDPVKDSFYRKIFTTQYNIVSRPHKTDTCDVCDATQNEIHLLESQPDNTASSSRVGTDLSALREKLASHKAQAQFMQKKVKYYCSIYFYNYYYFYNFFYYNNCSILLLLFFFN